MFTHIKFCSAFTSPQQEKPVVSERTQRVATPVIMTAPPAPPPRSTPLQARMVQQKQLQFENHPDSHPPSTTLPPSSVSLDDGEWGPASSGDLSAESNSPWFAGVRHTVLSTTGNPDSSQDGPGCVPDSGADELNRTASPVKSNEPLHLLHPPNQQVCDDQIVAQGHVRDSSDICETSFDDDITPKRTEVTETANSQSQPCNTEPSPHQQTSNLPAENKSEAEPNEVKFYVGTPCSKVAPPVPLRKSSALQHSNSSQLMVEKSSAVDHIATNTAESLNSKTTDLELKRLPSLKDRKKQLEAKMITSNSSAHPPQPADHAQPGRLVIQEELKGVSGGMPATQHPLLLKKQEENAAREREEREERERTEREREERERLAREMREKEEKPKGRSIFRRSRRDKGPDTSTESVSKAQRRRSMPISEQDELQMKFICITQSKPSSSGADPSPNGTAERTDGGEGERERLAGENELREW